MYANSRFKKKVNEWGNVEEWINPGEEISQGDLEGVNDEEWQSLIDSGAVVEHYPENLDPQTPPAEYYRNNPDEAPPIGVDENTPVHEAMPRLDTAGDSGKKLPGAEEGEKAQENARNEARQNETTTGEGNKAPWQK